MRALSFSGRRRDGGLEGSRSFPYYYSLSIYDTTAKVFVSFAMYDV